MVSKYTPEERKERKKLAAIRSYYKTKGRPLPDKYKIITETPQIIKTIDIQTPDENIEDIQTPKPIKSVKKKRKKGKYKRFYVMMYEIPDKKSNK
jgi:hypothetical protein